MFPLKNKNKKKASLILLVTCFKKNSVHVSLQREKSQYFSIYRLMYYLNSSFQNNIRLQLLENLFMHPVSPTYKANGHLSHKTSHALSTHTFSSLWNDLFLISTCWTPTCSSKLFLKSSSLKAHHWSSQENLISLFSLLIYYLCLSHHIYFNDYS